ncbi:fimbrial protein [Hafnia paralvei]|uniref:fimbrial protein n=1 Tax=Hafnia paralvei TaxID=546367 RepID=UPI00210B8EE6|nr:fimbrial protein [Hafnia paralvei]MCQ4170642.1 fimbrial protein [Hafnia paralvei]
MKIKSSLLIITFVFSAYLPKVFAVENLLTCNSYVVFTMSGTINAYVSQNNTDLINEGDYVISAPLSGVITCESGENDRSNHDSYFALDLSRGIFPPGTSASGKYALLPASGNAEKLAFIVGYQDAGGSINTASSSRIDIPMVKTGEYTYGMDSSLILSLVSSQGSSGAQPGTYVYKGTLGQYRQYDKTTDTYSAGAMFLGKVNLNLTVNLIATSCLVTTDKSIDIRWDGLTTKDIINNVADEKVANIGVNCNSSQTPVKITATSGNGYVDAAGGIVKTSRDNLGLKLTWEDTAQPVNFTTARTDTLTGNKYYNIVAKPVRYNEGAIALGEFANTVTVSLEYR